MSDSVGSVSVDVVPDARGWAEKLRAQIHDATVKVKADAETDEAAAKLDEVARDRTANIKAKVDKSQFSKATSALDGFLGKLGLIPALALTLGSALVPLTAVLGGVAAALAAPLAIGGGGATLFAFLGGLAVKQAQSELKNIDTLEKHLSTLTKGTAAYATAAKQLKDAQNALPPSVSKFSAALEGLKGAFAHVDLSILLKPITEGLVLLTKVLPLLNPVLHAVGDAFSSLIGDLSKGAGTRGFANFVDQFARLAGRDIRIGGHIAGELAKGIASLLLTTDKGFSGGFLRGLDHLSSSFADWASSKEARREMRDFFGYVHDVGPQVAHTIGAIARVLAQVVRALAPLGPGVLSGLEHAANGLARIPVPVLTALAGATAGLVGFQKLGGFKALGLLGRLGNVSAGGSAVSRLLGGAVQKVFVVNMPPGGLGGGPGGIPGETPGGKPGGGPGGRFGKVAGYAGYAGLAYAVTTALAGPLNDVYKNALGSRLGNVQSWLTSFVTRTPMRNGMVANVLPQSAVNAIAGAIRSGFHSLAHPSTPSGPHDGGTHNPVLEGRFPMFNPAYTTVQDSHSLTSTSNHLDALKAHAQAASRQLDLIGPHTQQSTHVAIVAIDALQAHINAVRDKKFAIIAQDQAAIQSLEALQRMRIADKNFNIYAHYQQIERAPGPGGGAGQNPHGSGGGGGGGGGGGAGLTVHVHGHIDENGYVSGTAQRVYDDNQRFASAHG